MTSLPSFPAFFEALWDYGPFPWQTMLAERIVAGRWPLALDLPTAAGKTACIDAAIYALAFQADKPAAERTAPRRIWFVVDRRIVVDEAFERASTIANKLTEAKGGPLKDIADRLVMLSGTTRPLAVARLRGGILRDDNWGRLPSQPAVITSTVDQLGSRLLFRGYGRSNLTASIFAGLAAHDSLILLDEAHCSVPFMQTLRAIENFRGKAWAEAPISTPFAFAALSATPPPEIPEEALFPGADRDRALDHPILRDRISASKPAVLVPVPVKVKGGHEDPLVIKTADQTWSYVADSGKARVAVIVNRVDTAKRIFDDLRHRLMSETLSVEIETQPQNSIRRKAVDVVLLTGRIRPYERDRLTERWKPFLKASSPKQPEQPIILVSTQCIEVGADFSFDALVTEAASLDALRQRFGRLNRMGAPGEAPATILIRDQDAREGQSDPIYGAAISQCWHLLDEKASKSANGDNFKCIDFGIDALDSVLAAVDDLSPYLAPRPDAPVLLPAYLDLLCQTAPAPAVEPDIRLFLHGKKKSPPEARVVWRADLAADSRRVWKEAVALCPPVGGEMLSVPLHRLRAWLANQDTEGLDIGDVEGAGYDDSAADRNGNDGGSSRYFLVWRGRDRSEVTHEVDKIKPDDVVIVPAEYGMLAAGQSVPAEALGKAEIDIWEPSWIAGGKPPALRLNSRVFQAWLEIPPVEDLINLAEYPSGEREGLQQAVDAVLAYEPVDDDLLPKPPQWLLDLLNQVRNGRVEDHPAGGVVLFARASASNKNSEHDLFADDDDLASSWTPDDRSEVTLADHSTWVKRAVEKIASRCLPEEFLDALRQAAYWHDVGKLDERFQLVLRQGSEIANDVGEPLAKSAFVPTSPARREAIRQAAGLPTGFRHEFLSFQLVERCRGLLADENADLVLHLVASHHGHARPFAPVAPDPDPPPVSGRLGSTEIELNAEDRKQLVEPHRLDSGVSDRFWRLTRQYGWWGLAYLEAVLRLADWYGSAHVVEDGSTQAAMSPQPRHEIGAPVVTTRDGPLVLTGPEGGNPLGFLAALGALAVLHEGICPQARLGWRRAVTWQPVLTNVSTADRDALSEAVAAALRGCAVSDDDESARGAAQRDFDAAKTALKDKRKEVRKRRLRGDERKRALDEEINPIEKETIRKRCVWLKALKKSVPSPELTIGKHIDCTGPEYRGLASSLLEDSQVGARVAVDFLAAFASDACVEKSEQVSATPFCFITGSGHQYFLDTVRQLMMEATAKRVHSALFEPWTYSDERLSLRWDPIEDRRYALMDRDPTASDNKSRTVWMANLLAYRALALFSSAPGRRRLETTGWGDSGRYFTWPIWKNPIDLDTIRSLMLLSELGSENPRRSIIRNRGICNIFRSPRIKVGSGANFKINFGPARGV
jgi:CRISPR-associated endonuclease/helicase Cas3